VEGVREVALSVPRVVGARGVSAQLFPELDEAEHAALERSARILKKTSSELVL
jgi:L-lactate dehydrogenase